MIKRFFRHIKEGVSNVSRNGAMSIASVSAVTITLILVSVFIILAINVQQITNSVEDQLTIHVRIDRSVETQEEITSLEDQIRSIEGVRTVTFVSRDQELEILIQDNDFYARYRGETNPLRDVFHVTTISGEVMQSVADQISRLNGINRASFGGPAVELLIDALGVIQRVGLILVVFLSLLAVFLISNTIKVTIYARKDEISLMRTVGATNGFIRAPFLVEGIVIGLFGATVPIILSTVGYFFLYQETGGILFARLLPLQPVMPFILYLTLILAGVGMIVGFIGSFISVTRYLRWKR